MTKEMSSSKHIIDLQESLAFPIKPVYRVDSMTNSEQPMNHGGIFLFETERPLVYTSKYVMILSLVSFFGCWICGIPSIILAIHAKLLSKSNQITRAKIVINVAFILSFFGLLLFAIQIAYLIFLTRYFLHRLITE